MTNKINNKFPNNELFEKLADIEHQRWADWQKYLHSYCEVNGNKVFFPIGFFERWERQIKTDYRDLTEEEKDSDREQVMRYWDLIN